MFPSLNFTSILHFMRQSICLFVNKVTALYRPLKTSRPYRKKCNHHIHENICLIFTLTLVEMVRNTGLIDKVDAIKHILSIVLTKVCYLVGVVKIQVKQGCIFLPRKFYYFPPIVIISFYFPVYVRGKT